MTEPRRKRLQECHLLVLFVGCYDYDYYMPGNRHHQPMRFFTFILSFRKLNGLFKSSPLGVLYSIFCSVLSCPGFLLPEIVSWSRKRWKELFVSGGEALSPGDEKQAGRWCHRGGALGWWDRAAGSDSEWGPHSHSWPGQSPCLQVLPLVWIPKTWRFRSVPLCISQVVMYLYTLLIYNLVHTFCLLIFILLAFILSWMKSFFTLLVCIVPKRGQCGWGLRQWDHVDGGTKAEIWPLMLCLTSLIFYHNFLPFINIFCGLTNLNLHWKIWDGSE